MERGYGRSELGFTSLTFSPFIITCHSLGKGFTTDGEGKEERVWPAINLSKLEMSRPTQPRQGAGGALISPLSRPTTLLSLLYILLHLSRCLVQPPHLDTLTQEPLNSSPAEHLPSLTSKGHFPLVRCGCADGLWASAQFDGDECKFYNLHFQYCTERNHRHLGCKLKNLESLVEVSALELEQQVRQELQAEQVETMRLVSP